MARYATMMEAMADTIVNALRTTPVTAALVEDSTDQIKGIIERILAPEFENYVETPDSSNIELWSYDEKSRVLLVEFNSSARYWYYGVEPEVAVSLASALSKGSFFSKEIKPNYPYSKVAA